MIKLLLSVSFWISLNQFGLCDFHPSYDPKDWPQHVIKFSDKGTLKDIFDAGIRPYRFPSLEKYVVEFKHSKIIIQLDSGERLPSIDVEWGGIDVLEGGLISNIEMTSPNLTTEEAQKAMTLFLPKGRRTLNDLKKFLSLVASNPTDYDDPYSGDPSGFNIVWNDVSGLTYYVGFKKTFDHSTPVSITLGANWDPPLRTPLENRSYYKVPIPPPLGYEDVSMDVPRNFGPDSAVEIARSKGLSITGDRTLEEYEKQLRDATNKTRDPKPKTPAVEPTPKSSEGLQIWIWLTGIFGFIATVMLFRKWRRKQIS